MCFNYAMLTYFIFSGIIFAQSYSKCLANVKVKLINGAMFNINKGNLDFNDLSKSFKGELKREPRDGVILHITGSKSGNIIINYGVSEVHKVNADRDKNDTLKTSEDFLLFQPAVQRANSLIDGEVVEILNGSTFAFDDEKKNGFPDICIGGTLLPPNLTLDGFYSGTFAVSLVYY